MDFVTNLWLCASVHHLVAGCCQCRSLRFPPRSSLKQQDYTTIMGGASVWQLILLSNFLEGTLQSNSSGVEQILWPDVLFSVISLKNLYRKWHFCDRWGKYSWIKQFYILVGVLNPLLLWNRRPEGLSLKLLKSSVCVFRKYYTWFGREIETWKPVSHVCSHHFNNHYREIIIILCPLFLSSCPGSPWRVLLSITTCGRPQTDMYSR